MPSLMEDNIIGDDAAGEIPSVPALDINYLKDRPIIIT